MPAAAHSSPSPHPETRRLLAVDDWTRDPAVAFLMTAVRALIPIGETLRELSARRPAIDRIAADSIGHLTPGTVETGRLNVWRRELLPSGAIALIWTELDALRDRWIAARLEAEGLDPNAPDVAPWYARLQELQDEAPSLTEAWGNAGIGATLDADAPLSQFESDRAPAAPWPPGKFPPASPADSHVEARP